MEVEIPAGYFMILLFMYNQWTICNYGTLKSIEWNILMLLGLFVLYFLGTANSPDSLEQFPVFVKKDCERW